MEVRPGRAGGAGKILPPPGLFPGTGRFVGLWQRGARLTSLLELRDRPAAVISASSQPWAMAAAERYERGSPGAHGAGAARQRGETVAPSRRTCPGWGAILSGAALGPAGGQQEGSRWHSLRGTVSGTV